MLICRPVSRRSAPQKIRNWIQDLQQKRADHAHDPDVCRIIDQCIDQATGWLSPAADAQVN